MIVEIVKIVGIAEHYQDCGAYGDHGADFHLRCLGICRCSIMFLYTIVLRVCWCLSFRSFLLIWGFVFFCFLRFF